MEGARPTSGGTEAEALLVAAQELLTAYRARYGKVQGGIRDGAVLHKEFGRLAVAVNECMLHPLKGGDTAR